MLNQSHLHYCLPRFFPDVLQLFPGKLPVHDTEKVFEGKKVLMVDDDMRNIFSLSAVLQEKHIEVITASNGFEALEQVEKEKDIALVLMDIMMPEMDGYEAMKKIREQEAFKSLPIIALTAKAMKGDRALCIE